MKIKLLLDEDVHSDIAPALRKRGFDAIHIQEVKLKGKTDKEQLDYAIKTERCLFSFNIKDFVLLHIEYIQNEKIHYGIIISKQLPLKITFHKILKFLQLSSSETIKNKLEFI